MTEIRKGIYKLEENDDSLFVKLDKEYFEKEPIMATLHEYSNLYFTRMDTTEDNKSVLISFTLKDKEKQKIDLELISNFSNRVIDHQIRKDLDRESGYIRDIITEYAYSSVKKKLI
jgi:His-Xaa-Ser system protein HxsD